MICIGRREPRRRDAAYVRPGSQRGAAHWNTYFTVEDTEAAIEQVKAGGGDKVMGPMDVEVGRIAVVHDPWGAIFSVIRLNETA